LSSDPDLITALHPLKAPSNPTTRKLFLKKESKLRKPYQKTLKSFEKVNKEYHLGGNPITWIRGGSLAIPVTRNIPSIGNKHLVHELNHLPTRSVQNGIKKTGLITRFRDLICVPPKLEDSEHFLFNKRAAAQSSDIASSFNGKMRESKAEQFPKPIPLTRQGMAYLLTVRRIETRLQDLNQAVSLVSKELGFVPQGPKVRKLLFKILDLIPSGDLTLLKQRNKDVTVKGHRRLLRASFKSIRLTGLKPLAA
jgi:hypothetical protein